MTTETAIVVSNVDRALMLGDVKALAPAERLAVVRRLVDEASLRWGGSPPVVLITTREGKLVPYLTKAGADQLAAIRGASVVSLTLEDRVDASIVEATATATSADRRTNVDVGACEYDPDRPASRARARMVAATRARRRTLLGLLGSGFAWSEDGDRAAGLEDVGDDAEDGEA